MKEQQNNFDLKKAYFLVHYNLGSWRKNALIYVHKIFIFMKNIYFLNKLATSLHFTTRWYKWSLLCLAKGPVCLGLKW